MCPRPLTAALVSLAPSARARANFEVRKLEPNQKPRCYERTRRFNGFLRFFNLYDKKRLSKRCEIISFEHTLLFFLNLNSILFEKNRFPSRFFPSLERRDALQRCDANPLDVRRVAKLGERT